MEQQSKPNEQQYQIFTVPLHSVKHANLKLPVVQAMAPSSNQILLLHTPDAQFAFPYTLLQVHSKQKVQIIQTGFLPCILQQCKLINKNILAGLGGFKQAQLQKNFNSKLKKQHFQSIENLEQTKFPNVNQEINTLIFYNFRQALFMGSLQYNLSEIYNQRCFFDLYFSYKNQILYNTQFPLVLCYKISQFKSINENRGSLDYQIGVYSINGKDNPKKLIFERVKKYKQQFQNHHTLAYFQNQVVAIENSGYSIQVYFIESKQRIMINSIYSLILIEVNPHQNHSKALEKLNSTKQQKNFNSKKLLLTNKSYLELGFSHDQLQDQQILLYAVEKSGVVTKIGKKIAPSYYQSQFMGSQNRSIECKSVFESQKSQNLNQCQKQTIKIKMKVRLQKRTKYFFIVDSLFKDSDNEFKETIMQLLGN